MLELLFRFARFIAVLDAWIIGVFIAVLSVALLVVAFLAAWEAVRLLHRKVRDQRPL